MTDKTEMIPTFDVELLDIASEAIVKFLKHEAIDVEDAVDVLRLDDEDLPLIRQLLAEITVSDLRPALECVAERIQGHRSMRRFKHFPCAKCGTVNADYLTFGVGFGDRARHYCLGHIPPWVRIRMRLRELAGRA